MMPFSTQKSLISKEPKIKIVFFACYTITNLKHYWQYLNDKADCWWVTWHPQAYAELKDIGCEKISFRNMLLREFRPLFLYKLINKIYSFYMIRNIHSWIKGAIDELGPDILITDTTKPLLKYLLNCPKCMSVQVFHSVSYKGYSIIPETLKYDLVLLPGEWHKKRFCQRFNIKNGDKLRVVGWPRGDDFINKRFGEADRDAFMKRLGLNPKGKNILYAPTHNAFCGEGLFPKSFGPTSDIFEEFCKRLKEMNVNLIVKLHPISRKLIRDVKLHRIAERYGAYLAYKNTTEYIADSDKNFLWISDVLISEVSGIIMDFMILNRPIVYIEPDNAKGCNWEKDTDLAKEHRAGEVVKSMQGLIEGVRKALKNPDEYKLAREKVLQEVFYKLDGRASERAANAILNYYKEFLKKYE